MPESFYEAGLEKLKKFGHKSNPVPRLHTADHAGSTILSRVPGESRLST
jgi:hypothetical protein